MAVGWRDKKGKFHEIPGAKAGEFKPVWTGAGDCIVKMVDRDDPASLAKVERHALTVSTGKDAVTGRCTCGWSAKLEDCAFPNVKKAMAEVNSRHQRHRAEEMT